METEAYFAGEALKDWRMNKDERDSSKCEPQKNLQQLKQASRTSHLRRARVRMLPHRGYREEEAVLAEGRVILDGRYRIERLLYKRPRLRVYLGYRLSGESGSPQEAEHEAQEPLVAIRELVLTGLPETVRELVEKAAFEEFVSPTVPGPPRLPTGGDRVCTEDERNYLVMQLRDEKSELYSDVITLDELLLGQKEWPAWLSEEVALNWGEQLCRIVARLHRLGVVLGDLDLSTILVSSSSATSWAPVLLTSWPPPLPCWQPATTATDAVRLQQQIFPGAKVASWNAFIAPEILKGRYDERSDVYTLGAILYLLFTHYAPAAAVHRLQVVAEEKRSDGERASVKATINDSLELIQPHILSHRIAPALEEILLHALKLDPEQRYPSMFALVEALETAGLEYIKANIGPKASGVRKMLMHIIKR